MPRLAEGSAPAATGPRPAFGPAGRRRAIARATGAFVTLGLLWRLLRYAMGQPLWGDEAFLAVNLLTRDLAGLAGPLEYRQIAPVGFLWAERIVVAALGPSEWAVRLIPELAGLASMLLFARFAAKVVDRRSACLAVGIFAASYYPVRHSAELKPYETDLFLALAATDRAWAVLRSGPSMRKWLTLGLTLVLGVWLSYPLVFVATGIGIVIAARSLGSRRVAGPAWWPGPGVAGVAAFGAIAASWAVFYFGFARAQAASAPVYTVMKTWRGAFPPWSRPWMIPAWLLDVHTGNMLAYPLGGNDFGSIATALLVAAGAWSIGRRRPRLVALLLAPLGPTLVASAFRLYPYGTSARTTLFMAPAFCLLAGSGAVALIRRSASSRRRWRWYRLAALALGSIAAVGSAVNLALPYKNDEDRLNRDAIAGIAAEGRPGDRYSLYDGLPRLPDSPGTLLEHWLQQVAEVRYNALARLPGPVGHDPDAAAIDADPVAPPARSWLIVHRTGCPDFDEDRLEAARARLVAAKGPPAIRWIYLTRGERIEVERYGPP